MPEENSTTKDQPLEYAKEYVEKVNKELEDLSKFYNNLKDKQVSYQKILNKSLQDQLRSLLMASEDIEKKLDDIHEDIHSMKPSIPAWRW